MKNISLRAKVFFLTVFFGIILITALNAGVVSIPACAARPSDDETTASSTWYSDASEFYFDTDDITDVYIPVNLPNGVSVKKFSAILSDGSGGQYDISVALLRVNLLTGISEDMAGVSTTVPGTYNRKLMSDTSINHKIVNNNLYAYALRLSVWYAYSDKKFHGAQIFY